jgi:hypothetical protein
MPLHLAQLDDRLPAQAWALILARLASHRQRRD